MKIALFTKKIVLLLTATIFITSCGSDDSVNEGVDEGSNDFSQKFVIAATKGSSSYMLTTNNLDQGSSSLSGKGIEIGRVFTHFINYKYQSLVGLIYGQGGTYVGYCFILGQNGKLQKLKGEGDMGFQVSSFNTVGTFGDYMVAARGTQPLADGTTGAIFSFIQQNGNNLSITTKTLHTDNIVGNGNPTISGILDIGNGEFLTSLVNPNDPDKVYIIALDIDLNVKRIYTDNRISYSCGRWRSAMYSQLGMDDSGNIYVFSGSYESTTTKPAGALRISKGSTSFDKDYYFNIEEVSGGYRFRKVFHITEDYFLLEFYNELEYQNTSPASQYAIVKMNSKKFTWLRTGFPSKDQITGTGWPLSYQGKIYYPVTTSNDQPTVYEIDPKTVTAKAGLVVEAEGITGISLLKK
ncbi:DUF4374 domain-containing protein [Apibacter adventoris]|uniref:DUF4374 domain-containing protein n=1 Tax=Apibacter adventoris TaxID=1679466 RepID=A0A2S8AGC5_9FLAO|nr:DUF4374 domain-containing protein [Apibacter adventoris]PQL95316.1 hypothetical protein C4S77_00520 [Apibacter adventoris]